MSTASPQAIPVNEDKMNAFLGKVVGDFGASLSSALVYIGQKLGLYKAMAEAGPITPAELAQRTNTNERYVREWLINQAAGGYAQYDTQTSRYSLSPEQVVALTDEHSPFYVGGGFFVIKAMTGAVERIESYFPQRRRHAVGRAPSGSVRRHGTILPPWLCRTFDCVLDSLTHRN